VAAVIEIQGLTKRFGSLHVLRGLDLVFEKGRVTAILGPNGAGKTTLVKSVLGLVRPDAGRIRVNGAPLDEAGDYRRAIGYMPQIARYPENLRVREILAMIRDLRGDPADVDDELERAFELESELEKPFKNLSGGNRQRVSAVLAFLFRPEILFLDEPTAGLDPLSSSRLKDKILAEKKRGRTVVLTSHFLADVQELADEVVYLLEGAVSFRSPLETLLQETGERSLERAIARRVADLRAAATPGRTPGESA
jgi:Cu-processing system ATP-binding protein